MKVKAFIEKLQKLDTEKELQIDYDGVIFDEIIIYEGTDIVYINSGR